MFGWQKPDKLLWRGAGRACACESWLASSCCPCLSSVGRAFYKCDELMHILWLDSAATQYHSCHDPHRTSRYCDSCACVYMTFMLAMPTPNIHRPPNIVSTLSSVADVSPTLNNVKPFHGEPQWHQVAQHTGGQTIHCYQVISCIFVTRVIV